MIYFIAQQFSLDCKLMNSDNGYTALCTHWLQSTTCFIKFGSIISLLCLLCDQTSI